LGNSLGIFATGLGCASGGGDDDDNGGGNGVDDDDAGIDDGRGDGDGVMVGPQAKTKNANVIGKTQWRIMYFPQTRDKKSSLYRALGIYRLFEVLRLHEQSRNRPSARIETPVLFVGETHCVTCGNEHSVVRYHRTC
jgi:hypothetical protein